MESATLFTKPAIGHFENCAEIRGFLGFLDSLVGHIDKSNKLVRTGLYELTGEEEYKTRMEQPGTKAKDALETFRQFTSQMILCRFVDSYLCYISGIVSLIFQTKPETLKSSEKVEVSRLLEYQTMEELISALVDEKVTKLSYKSIQDVSSFLAERLGFSILEDANSMSTAIRIITTRNLVVHNRAIMNRFAAARVQEFTDRVGERILLNPKQLAEDLEFLCESIRDIDRRAITKFDLPAGEMCEMCSHGCDTHAQLDSASNCIHEEE
jgi:hypothetical protein